MEIVILALVILVGVATVDLPGRHDVNTDLGRIKRARARTRKPLTI